MFPLCLCISNARIVCSVFVLTASATADYEWFYAFMKQHSDISLCKPEPLSVARAMGMNETVKNAWFDEVEAAVDQLGIKATPGSASADEQRIQSECGSGLNE